MPQTTKKVSREMFVNAVKAHLSAKQTSKAADIVKETTRKIIVAYLDQEQKNLEQVPEIDAVVQLIRDERSVFDQEKAKKLLGDRAIKCHTTQAIETLRVEANRTQEMLAAIGALNQLVNSADSKIPRSLNSTGSNSGAGPSNKKIPDPNPETK